MAFEIRIGIYYFIPLACSNEFLQKYAYLECYDCRLNVREVLKKVWEMKLDTALAKSIVCDSININRNFRRNVPNNVQIIMNDKMQFNFTINFTTDDENLLFIEQSLIVNVNINANSTLGELYLAQQARNKSFDGFANDVIKWIAKQKCIESAETLAPIQQNQSTSMSSYSVIVLSTQDDSLLDQNYKKYFTDTNHHAEINSKLSRY